MIIQERMGRTMLQTVASIVPDVSGCRFNCHTNVSEDFFFVK
jgi:hypothetical protein